MKKSRERNLTTIVSIPKTNVIVNLPLWLRLVFTVIAMLLPQPVPTQSKPQTTPVTVAWPYKPTSLEQALSVSLHYGYHSVCWEVL